MKTIVAGSRTITDKKLVFDIIKSSNIQITELVCGMALGVDWIGKLYAEENNIEWRAFLPDWNQKCMGAGPFRNSEMAEYAEALILVWDGTSKGSADMLAKAKKKGLLIEEYIVKDGIVLSTSKPKSLFDF